MSLAVERLPVTNPIWEDERGALRVGQSRVTLLLVIREFERGASCEEIALRYDSLRLGEVYAAISAYLEHQPIYDSILAQAQAHAVRQQAALEERFGTRDVRERLLARRLANEVGHAPLAHG